MSKYRHFRESGFTFVFKNDDDAPDLLHIYARHLTAVDDALDVFFDTQASQIHSVAHNRYERYNTTHGLFWFWLDEPGKVVMVVTCFPVDGGIP